MFLVSEKQKSLFSNFSICLLSCFISFAFAEFIVRLNPQWYCQGYRPAKNKKIVYELYPNYALRSLNAKISPQGLNDRVFSAKKPRGIFRIAVLGDSGSFGWKVGRENSFPKVLEALLNEKRLSYEVLNFSVPGYNTAQELELLKEKVLAFDPDMVFLAYCWNDVNLCNFFQPDINLLNFLFHKSFLLHYLLWRADLMIQQSQPLSFRRELWGIFKKRVLGMFYAEESVYPYPGLEVARIDRGNPPSRPQDVPRKYWYMLGYENYEKHLTAMRRLLDEKEILFVSGGIFNSEEEKINKDAGISFVFNLGEFLKTHNISYREIRLPDDPHPSVRGHQLIANYLLDFLLEKELISLNLRGGYRYSETAKHFQNESVQSEKSPSGPRRLFAD